MLIASGVAPILLFSTVLGFRSALDQRDLIAVDMARQSVQLATTLDREMFVLQQPLFALAGSESLSQGDLAAFHARATDLSRRVGWNISLTDATGQQLLNTRSPFGARLGVTATPPSAPQTVQTGVATISGVVQAASDGRSAVIVSLPVTVAGRPGFSLHMNIIGAITAIVEQQHVEPGGIIAVVDSAHRILARQPSVADAVGKVAVPAAVSAIENRTRSSFDSISREGVATSNVLYRMESTGWTVLVGIPKTTLFGAIYSSLWNIAAVGLASMAVASALTIVFGRRLARQVALLSQMAGALELGQPVASPSPSGIREIDTIGQALVRTSLTLQSRTAEREFALGALQQEVADRKKVEAQLVHAQKMESVGRLTSGIAHDFNNILAAIVGSIELVEDKLAADDEGLAALRNGIEAAMLGSELTGRLLAFARQQPLAPTEIDINDIVAMLTPVLRRTLGGQVQVESILDGDLWMARADSSQVQDALLNLSINARDAMPDGGLLRIETRNVTLDADYADRHIDAVPGDYVMLSVTDNGSGMPPEVMARAFEPFFTTKEAGRGSGLGLSMVYGFAQQSAGHLNIYSEQGTGTSVKLYLPRCERADETRAEVPARPVDLAQGGSETVMVVDDFDAVRRIACRTLRDLGYLVVEASNAEKALALIDRGQTIDLLFTDIVMPGGMTGRALAEEVWARLPRLPVLFTSGFVGMSGEGTTGTGSRITILHKPYRRQELAARVREALAAAQPA